LNRVSPFSLKIAKISNIAYLVAFATYSVMGDGIDYERIVVDYIERAAIKL
jgi:hypothetical protein